MIKLNRFNQATELAQRKLEKLYNDEICTTEMIEPIEKAISLMWTEHEDSLKTQQTELATMQSALETQSATIAALRSFIRDFATADAIKAELLQAQATDWVKVWDSASTEAHESQEE